MMRRSIKYTVYAKKKFEHGIARLQHKNNKIRNGDVSSVKLKMKIMKT